jgi:acetoin utilization deacetylase AcuC-like enzyme
VQKALRAPEFEDLSWREAPMGTRAQLLLIHTPEYVDKIFRVAPTKGYVPLDAGDTIMSPGSLEAVLRCVGATCAGVDALMKKEAQNVFCATRPCGHHTEPDRAMGFSIFNQAAIAAAYAYDTHKLERVAVVDFDVHHGNGTQDAFYYRPEMFYTSCHQSPFYPGSGAKFETGVDHNVVNVPLSRGTDSATFRSRIEAEMLPPLRKFNPSFIIISAGFDAHIKDPLGGLNLTDRDYHWITKEIMKIADECCEGRIVSTLEGGYSLDGLATGCASHVRALMGK